MGSRLAAAMPATARADFPRPFRSGPTLNGCEFVVDRSNPFVSAVATSATTIYSLMAETVINSIPRNSTCLTGGRDRDSRVESFDVAPDARQLSALDIRPGAIHLLDQPTIQSIFHVSAFVKRDSLWGICSRCGDLDIIHTPSCAISVRGSVCLFCCGCYFRARDSGGVGAWVSKSGVEPAAGECAPAWRPASRGAGDYDYYEGGSPVNETPQPVAVTSGVDASELGAVTPPLPASSVVSGPSPDAHDVLSHKYSELLLAQGAFFEFNHRGKSACVVADLVVTAGSSTLGRDELPLPRWCHDGEHHVSGALDVKLDQRRLFVVQFLPARVNGSIIHVGVCNCNRYVADNVKRLLAFPARLDIAPDSSIQAAYSLYLRDLMRRQQGGLPNDMLVCRHINGATTALYNMRRAERGACGPNPSVVVRVDEQDFEVTFVGGCGAYCVARTDENPEVEVALVQRSSFKFTCSAVACKYHKQRCIHLRAIARRISDGRAINASFVLGKSLQDDNFLLLQATNERGVRSSRTPEQSLELLKSFTAGPLPLSLREAGPAFRDAAFHRHGWATLLVPDAPSQCPKCSSTLLKPAPRSSTCPPTVSGNCAAAAAQFACDDDSSSGDHR